MIPNDIQQLLDHMEWADALAWSAVAGLDAAARDDDHVAHLLHHAHTVQWVYLNLWREEPLNMPELATFPDVSAVRAWAREYYGELAGFLDGLDEEALEVPMHSHYHRAQLATRIRELGGEPPLTDFVAWTWAGRPAARWPEDDR